MNRTPKPTDFQVPVPGIGSFTFGRRNLGDQLAIRKEFLRLNGDNEKDMDLANVATVLATLNTMCVSAPAGWEDPENIDMLAHPDAFDDMFKIADALKEKEDSFRRGVAAAVPAGGEGDVRNGTVLVQEEVQPAAKLARPQ